MHEHTIGMPACMWHAQYHLPAVLPLPQQDAVCPGLQWCTVSYQAFLTVFLSEQAVTSLPPCEIRLSGDGPSSSSLCLLQIWWSSGYRGSSVFIRFCQTHPRKCLILAKDDLILFNCQQEKQSFLPRVAVIGRGKHKYSLRKEMHCCHPSSKWGTSSALGSSLRFPAACFWRGSLYSGTSLTAYSLFHIYWLFHCLFTTYCFSSLIAPEGLAGKHLQKLNRWGHSYKVQIGTLQPRHWARLCHCWDLPQLMSCLWLGRWSVRSFLPPASLTVSWLRPFQSPSTVCGNISNVQLATNNSCLAPIAQKLDVHFLLVLLCASPKLKPD